MILVSRDSSPVWSAVVDANVLFPFALRDTILRVAEAGLFRLRWSAEILDEVERNLIGTATTTAEKAASLRAQLERIFPDAAVRNYRALAAGLQNDFKDRHVVAAALKSKSRFIVTSNLRDFVPIPSIVEAISPDAFLCGLLREHRALILQVLDQQAAFMRRPPVTVDQLLSTLSRSVPKFAAQAGTVIVQSPES